MRARLIKIACLMACSLVLRAFAGEQAITSYEGTTSQSPIQHGCTNIILNFNAFTGTIGNATYVSTTGIAELRAVGDNQRLGTMSYTVTGGHLYIIEIK